MALNVRGSPFVPGCARGRLRRGGAHGGAIAVVAQHELDRLTGEPAGVIVVGAAPFSHAMIRLLSVGRPAVTVSAAQAAGLPDGVEVTLDGSNGFVTTDGECRSVEPPAPPPGRPVLTADQVAVELCASVRDAPGAAAALARGAASLGLVRSEFLQPPDGGRPDAAFYERTVGELCAAASPLPVTLRLLDIGPDKRPRWLGEVAGFGAPLGLRGAGLYEHEPVRSVLAAQLEAVARLIARSRLRLLVPFVAGVGEFERLRAHIEASLPRRPLIGAMVETPAAAMAIADFCEAADFVALGTNDLMQCLFAADRELSEMRDALDPYAPALHRFLRLVAEGAGARLHRLQVCGLLAQLPGVLPLLLGLGYRAFSVDPVFIPWLARAVAQTDTRVARAAVESVCAARTSGEVRALLSIVT